MIQISANVQQTKELLAKERKDTKLGEDLWYLVKRYGGSPQSWKQLSDDNKLVIITIAHEFTEKVRQSS